MENKSPSESIPGAETSNEKSRQDLRDCQILVVEDSPDQRRFLARVLEGAGAVVTLECNGQAAVEVVSKTAGSDCFDAIVMDLQMPVMDGLTATQRLREDGFEQPIIAVTAYASADLKEQWFAAGCNAFLEKPLAPAALVAAIKQRLNCGKS